MLIISLGVPIETALCHCKDCQKWSGGGYTSNVIIPTSAFRLTKGIPKCYTNYGLSGKEHPHYFCGGKPSSSIFCHLPLSWLLNCSWADITWISTDCGSSLYVQPVAMGDVTVIKAGTLDEGVGNMHIDIERFTQDRNSYCKMVQGAVQAKTMV